ncbi:NADH-ubiquinone reductase complex 1 MLRQ subunit [Corchorus capsularis]|uniref:NADH-ubiquinone reductase complex 1 MLRQ subunit n=1 Tax=Corchorus capsularis TaxID=210143 RepID=A0A1R3GQU3_COCAP|nr:NADH-ubiquinone reductase complex 1 MLRQ subunit [Corchorus capsularis]
MATTNRWLRPEICVMRMLVPVTKEHRSAGILENYEEGERYAEHSLRKFVRKKRPEIMPSINNFFSDPNH